MELYKLMKVKQYWLEHYNVCSQGWDWYVEQGTISGAELINRAFRDKKYSYIIWALIRKLTKQQQVEFGIAIMRYLLFNKFKDLDNIDEINEFIDASVDYIAKQKTDNIKRIKMLYDLNFKKYEADYFNFNYESVPNTLIRYIRNIIRSKDKKARSNALDFIMQLLLKSLTPLEKMKFERYIIRSLLSALSFDFSTLKSEFRALLYE